jgi:hypothetical protein
VSYRRRNDLFWPLKQSSSDPDIAKIPTNQRSLDQKVVLKRYFQTTFRPLDRELADYTKAMAEAPGVKGEVQAQTLAERRVPRTTPIHIRGNFLDRGT